MVSNLIHIARVQNAGLNALLTEKGEMPSTGILQQENNPRDGKKIVLVTFTKIKMTSGNDVTLGLNATEGLLRRKLVKTGFPSYSQSYFALLESHERDTDLL